MHLNDEDMARLYKGNVSRKEKTEYIEHLSECEECLEVYSLSIKDLEELKQETKKSFSTVLSLNRKFVLSMAATVLICILTITIFLIYNSLEEKMYNIRLKELIQKKYRYQSDFAKETNIADAIISQIIRGDRPPTLKQAQVICNKLNVLIEDVFPHKEDIDA